MRTLGAALVFSLAVVASACTAGGDEAGPGGASATATPTAVTSDTRVSDAVTQARTLATGRYTVTATLRHAGGTQTVERTAVYDLAQVRGSVDQTITTGRAAPVRVRGLRAGSLRWVTVSTWTGRANGKWARLLGSEPEGLVEERYALEHDLFPALLAVLQTARPSTEPSHEPTVVRVDVQAGDVLPAIPLPAVRAYVRRADLSAVTARVGVDVTIRRGVVTGLTFDATEALAQALGVIGVPQANVARLRDLSVSASFSGYASRVHVPLPQRADVLSDAEFRAVQR